MRALTVVPRRAGSLALTEVPDPVPGPGDLLVESVAVGVCGTDREVIAGDYGYAPPGRERLIIGHESLGRVRQAPAGSGFSPGDLVVGLVRYPDPVPCVACAHGEPDMCRNGRYTMRGLKELDGYASELWSVETDRAVRLDSGLGESGVLLQPASVVAKAWEQIEKIGRRSWYEPRRVLVTGAGPFGMLAALLGVQRGLDVHVFDFVKGGPKAALVADLGATYHTGWIEDVVTALKPDVVVEACGAAEVFTGTLSAIGPYGIVCLTGVTPGSRRITVDVGMLNREMVLENAVVIGTIDSNLRHFTAAAGALAVSNRDWLARLISRRVPLHSYAGAYERRENEVKVVLTFG
ncbi:glucose 1-dehydrogenase [Microbispora sp. H10670]|uniref:glucose 1-dehydrogenase n=1 Tax=Microbispora sp. H10670 TaxID=2729108 RepID=UPI00160445C9|nr:glucose 1-dehydrogenase [Microbispora sp. H10670]